MASVVNLFSTSYFRHYTSYSSDSRVNLSIRASLSEKTSITDNAKEIRSHEKTSITELSSGVKDKKKKIRSDELELKPLWDDGYGETTVKDYFEISKDMVHNDGGPPRWFCPVECGRPIKDSPALFFLPGIDGLGVGLCLHHRALGRVFEVSCLHIPVYDRTPFQELVRIVESSIRLEHALHPDKPIYLLGDSFGGSLALAVAARNPSIDLVVILVNPATSIEKSQLKPLFPIMEAVPDELHVTLPYLLSFIMGDPVRMSTVNIDKGLPPTQALEQLSANLTAILPYLGGLADIIPKETLLWKLKLLKAGASYANSRLHAVKAEVLVLASGNDNMLPSREEAQRLLRLLKNCRVQNFRDNGHTLLLEDGVHLLSVLKSTDKYRRSRRHDFVSDFLPPSHTEFKSMKGNIAHYDIVSPVILSTLEDGNIVKGLAGIPEEGPILFVGNHMLFVAAGVAEITPFVLEFCRERKVMVRTLAHPLFFSPATLPIVNDFFSDRVRQFGGVPVTPGNIYKLLSSNSFTVLYPGGIREVVHRKGEEYQLFWPEQPEFVRMAARFEATIIPFGVVGEDDVAEVVFDYNEQMRTPILRDLIKEFNKRLIQIRDDAKGEVANQDLHLPGVIPKIPGRFYYLFGKPIKTKGRKELRTNKESANELYSHIKAEAENAMSYLKQKREKDPYRGIVQRTIYKASQSSIDSKVPTFEL